MRRLAIIIAFLVIFPIIEIAVLISIGQVIGVGWTLLLMLATSALGAWLLRREGGRAWRTFQDDVQAGRPPGKSATDGLLVLVGGIFMLVPGFVSDVIGALFIAPPTRRLARIGLLALVDRRISPSAATTLFGPRRVRARSGPAAHGPPQHGTTQHGPKQDGPTVRGASAGGPSVRGQASTDAPGQPVDVVDGATPIEGEIIDPRR
jgi:UPF0716 protein FxsA